MKLTTPQLMELRRITARVPDPTPTYGASTVRLHHTLARYELVNFHPPGTDESVLPTEEGFRAAETGEF